jgi:hypothetical protein
MICSSCEEGEWESGGRDGDRERERERETQDEILFFFVK